MGNRSGEHAGLGPVTWGPARPPRRRRGVGVATVLALCLVVVGYSLHFFAGVYVADSGDASDYAAMGRNLARGEGFRTSVVCPLQLALFPHQNPNQAPNLHRPPLLPLWYSLLFRLIGCRAWLVWASSALFVAGGALLIVFGGPPEGGARTFAAAAFLFYPTTVVFAASGMTEPPAALLCLALAARLARDSTARGSLAAMGLLAGLATLLKYPLAVLLPFLLIHVGRRCTGRARWTAVSLILIAWLAVVAPWLARNALVAGSPVYTLQSKFEATKALPGYELFRAARGTTPLGLRTLVLHEPSAVWHKALAAWREYFFAGGLIHGLPLLAALAAWWVWRKRDAARPLAFWLGVNVALLLILAPINLEPRYLYATAMPLWAHVIAHAYAEWRRPLRIAAGTLLVVILTAQNLHTTRMRPRPGDFSADLPIVMHYTAPDALILTDADTYVAWRADRTALWFPSDQESLQWLAGRCAIDAVYLQQGAASDMLFHFSDKAAVVEELRRRFPVQHPLPGDGLLLTR